MNEAEERDKGAANLINEWIERDLSSQILMASQISLVTQRTRKMETCLHINDQWQTKRNQEREDASRSVEIPHPSGQ